MEVIVTIVSKLVYNLLKGLITYLYTGYNPVTKYHGHPSIHPNTETEKLYLDLQNIPLNTVQKKVCLRST